MKLDSLKNLLKTTVKEAFREELKDIILEVLKSNNNSIINENQIKPQKVQIQNNNLIETNNDEYNSEEIRKNYLEMVGGNKQIPLSENDISTFRPRSTDMVNGALPEGNVGLDQIMGLMTPKR